MATDGSIFEASLEVSFDRLKQDLKARGISRLLWQFRRSPVIRQVVERLSEQLQDTYDATFEILEGRTLAKAEGVNLDILGYLVGQPRQFGDVQATDYNYRRFILAKILKNHADGGTLIENRYCAQFISGIAMSFVKIDLQTYRMIFAFGVNVDDIRLLRATWKNQQVDNYYLLPVPATVLIDTEIAIVTPFEDDKFVGFGPDLYEMRPDFAKAAVGIYIGD